MQFGVGFRNLSLTGVFTEHSSPLPRLMPRPSRGGDSKRKEARKEGREAMRVTEPGVKEDCPTGSLLCRGEGAGKTSSGNSEFMCPQGGQGEGTVHSVFPAA